jgi:hypothetical protein
MLKINNTLFSNNIHSIMIGLMLGDGHLYRSSPTSNCRLEMSFGKDRELFANSIAELFKDYSKAGVKTVHYKSNHSSPSLNYNYRFKTKTLPIFNFYHDLFYVANNETWKFKKIIPYNISEFMDPIEMAYLLMTDGNFDKSRQRIRIYTNGYSKAEVETLAKAINLKLEIYVGVLHDRKDQWILTIGSKQFETLRNKVSAYFEPSMLYRIGL